MADQPLVSIIIPCFNNETYVAEAIESALAQTYDNVEIIVVNDGSTDSSGPIIESYSDRVSVIHQANAGACAARNRGLAQARGEWIKFLDADDILVPNCVALQLEQTRDREVIVFGDYKLLGSFRPGFVDRSRLNIERLAGLPVELGAVLGTSLFISTTLYPTSVLRRFDGFDPSVNRGQEHELHVRLYLNGVDFEYHPCVCFHYRQHDGPSRISNSQRLENYLFEFGRFQALVNLARNGPRKGEFAENRRVLAGTAWRIGRRLQRLGRSSHASAFFKAALSMDGRRAIQGRAVYRFVTILFGPQIGERLSIFIRIFLGLPVEYQEFNDRNGPALTS